MSGKFSAAVAQFRAETPPVPQPGRRQPLAAAADVNRVVGNLREQADDRLGKLNKRLIAAEGEIENLYSNAEICRHYAVRAEQRVDLLTEILVDAGLIDARILRDPLTDDAPDEGVA